MYWWAGHTAQPNTSASGLERENLILGYGTQRERPTGGLMQPEMVKKLQQLSRLSEDMQRLLGVQ